VAVDPYPQIAGLPLLEPISAVGRKHPRLNRRQEDGHLWSEWTKKLRRRAKVACHGPESQGNRRRGGNYIIL